MQHRPRSSTPSRIQSGTLVGGELTVAYAFSGARRVARRDL